MFGVERLDRIHPNRDFAWERCLKIGQGRARLAVRVIAQ
jgi:hypothetical protein